MTTTYDVPSEVLIQRLAKHLEKDVESVSPPPWSAFAKTGVHTKFPPSTADWWYVRCASLLRKAYVKGPIGLSKLRLEYGGRKAHGRRPEHHKRSGGAGLRHALQQLETAGLIKILPAKGRALTREGRSLMDRSAKEIKAEMKKEKQE